MEGADGAAQTLGAREEAPGRGPGRGRAQPEDPRGRSWPEEVLAQGRNGQVLARGPKEQVPVQRETLLQI